MKSLILFLTVLMLNAAVFADVPPAPGSQRVRPDLVLEAKDDLPGYVFIFESPMAAEKISIQKGQPTVLEGKTRGGASRMGTLYAIPVKEFESSGIDLNRRGGERIADMIESGKLPGGIKLLNHSFQKDVPILGSSEPHASVYNVEFREGRPFAAAIESSGGEPSGTSNHSGPLYSTEPKSAAFWAAVVGGSQLTLALIVFGVWFVRRR